MYICRVIILHSSYLQGVTINELHHYGMSVVVIGFWYRESSII